MVLRDIYLPLLVDSSDPIVVMLLVIFGVLPFAKKAIVNKALSLIQIYAFHRHFDHFYKHSKLDL